MSMIFIAGRALYEAAQAERAALIEASGVPYGHGRSEVLCRVQQQQAGRGLLGAQIVKSMYGYSVRYDSGLQDWGLLHRAGSSREPTFAAALDFCRRWVAEDPAHRYAWHTETHP